MRKFILNLSFISQPRPRVAAMVVSDTMERLSPNMAPATQAARAMFTLSPACSTRPTAMGAMAVTEPTEVPMETAMKPVMSMMPM